MLNIPTFLLLVILRSEVVPEPLNGLAEPSEMLISGCLHRGYFENWSEFESMRRMGAVQWRALDYFGLPVASSYLVP
jgi:hypothetical protein